MAGFTELPPEIVEDIIFYVFLCDQYTPPLLEGFKDEEASPLIEVRAQCLTDYAKSKITTLSFTHGIRAVHACPGNDSQFHDGLHRMFYEQRCRRNGLLALSLTSKWLHNQVKQLLWSLVEIDGEKYQGPRRAQDLLGRPIDRFLLSLMKCPDLGLSVKTFAFGYTPLIPIGWHDLRVDCPREGEVPTTIRWNDHPGMENPELSDLLPEATPASGKKLVYWTKTSNLLSYLPNLRSLKFSINYSDGPGGIYTFSKSFISRLSGLQNLTELSMIWLGTSAIEFTSLVELFFLPSLRILYLSDLMFDEEYATEDDNDVIPRVPIELRRKSGVKELILDFAYVESGPLIALLQLPAALEKFAYSFVSEGIFHCNPSPGRFYDFLYPHRKSLQELDIVGCRNVRNANASSIARPFRGRCAKQVLKEFPALRKLGCPAETLKARWDPNEQMWHEDLWYGGGIHEVLPTSLASLKLYIYDDWSIHGWEPDLLSLFKSKTLGFPDLKEIWIEYWIAGERFNDGSVRDVAEIVRRQIEELKIEARKVDIMLEVRVDERNKTSLE